LTGYNGVRMLKKRKRYIAKRREIKIGNDSVMFGFDNIKGFPVEYSTWCYFLGHLHDNNETDIAKTNKYLAKKLDQAVEWAIEDDYLKDDDMLKAWDKNRDFDSFLNKCLFVEKDQVVVPSLNLKAAKKIICRNEKQKKKLRKMGFIEDRILIRNGK